MNVIRTEKFISDFMRLPGNCKKLVIKQLEYLNENPRHPSLHTKRIQGSNGIFEIRINKSVRLTFHLEPNTLVLRRVGPHDETLKRP